MPPQGYVVLGGIGLNYVAHRRHKTTICQFARLHPIATALVLGGGNLWLWPHIYRPLWRAAKEIKQ